jgi:putative glutamine amidotransferase
MQSTRPIIGITPSPMQETNPAFGDVTIYRMTNTYTSAVETAGGIPVVLPPTDPSTAAQVVARLDALLLSGGGDIRPARYRDTGPQHEKTYGISDARDAWEDALLEAAFAIDLPVLCICRGIQVLNVFCGGTLWQDVPTQMPGAESYKQPQGEGSEATAHTVAASGLLAAVYGMAEIGTNSFHHQGIKEVGAGLVACGQTPDGLVEAVEMPERSFVLAMQWHPEAMFAERPEHEAPFRALVAAAVRRGALSVAD